LIYLFVYCSDLNQELHSFPTRRSSDLELEHWKEFLGRLKNPTQEVTIGLIGKYVSLPDAYKSIIEAFIHAGAVLECKVHLKLISDRKSTRLNSSHVKISYAVFCLKKKT